MRVLLLVLMRHLIPFIVLLLAGCAVDYPTIQQPAGTTTSELTILEYDPTIGQYQRDFFGQRWSDDVNVEYGHNGCDTRNDILARDLNNIVYKQGTRDCVVTNGDFIDPYTGSYIVFERGQNTSDLVPIDHVVALANAWYSGAYAWDDELRRDFANDPRNLQATTKDANQSKLAKTANEWLPSNPDYQCEYVRRQVEIKRIYGLGVTAAELETMNSVLANCP